jgi:branched-subunit amino acid transport protein
MNPILYFILALLVTAGITYLIRLLPILFVRKRITNRFLKSFLYYVPHVVLSVLAFPAIFTATGNMISGVTAAVVCMVMAYMRRGLLSCMLSSVTAALIAEVILMLL